MDQKKILILIALIKMSMFSSGQIHDDEKSWRYPEFETTAVEEVLHGKKILDQYRALESRDNAKSKKWYNDQKHFYSSIIENISGRESLKEEIEKYLYSSNVKCDLPKSSSKGIYFTKRFVRENIQKIIFKETDTSEEIEIFNTEKINGPNKTYNIDYIEPSYDGRHLAFGISFGGSEMSTIKVYDLSNKVLLSDSIERAMYGNPQWLPDGSGFFYNQLVEYTDNVSFENSEVKLHLIGEDANKDRIVFSKNLNQDLSLTAIDFPLLLINPTSKSAMTVVYRGSSPYATIYTTSLAKLLISNEPVTWKKICNAEDKVSEFTLLANDVFVITYKENPYGILEKRNIESPVKTEKIINASGMVLNNLLLTKNAIYVNALKNGNNKVISVSTDDFKTKEVKMPLDGTIEIRSKAGFQSAYCHTDDLYLAGCTWTKDWSIFKYQKSRSEVIKTNIQPTGAYSELRGVAVREIEVRSHDGAMVPLTVIYPKNIKLDGHNPTILYGYGAYGISKSPNFNYALLPWFDKGGIYAIAHVRGGGEKGEDWYKGGFKATKPNSWKDFIACAEYLISNNYTSSFSLAADGASAGGITVGRAMTERPDLFKATVISYGAVHSLRDEFTSNTLSTSEFGTIKDSLEFSYLYEMDVYHHIQENVKYPSTLLTAGFNDSRVAFWQPAKVAAKMQSFSNSENIVLLRLSDEGHWGVSAISNDLADRYVFLLWQLGHSEFKLKK